MASSPQAMTPPPGPDQGSPSTPTTPVAASPSPAQPSPSIQQGAQGLISVVNMLRGIAKAYPAASEEVTQSNDLIRKIMAKIMTQSNPGEPQAGPVG